MSHDDSTGDQSTNRLIDETSPYLLQHARNPVDWYPWGKEALAKARELNRPVFLSIGYSACHWCHVMEHESFENPSIASVMNEYFVCIKVDREERPDLDQIYMTAVQLITGRGGWPMSVFLTPQLQPFYGGTYWPPESKMGMPGFREVLEKVHEAWTERRNDVNKGAAELTAAIQAGFVPQGRAATLDESLLQNAARDLSRAADPVHGGFGRAPKFPHPVDIRVLLRAWKRFGNDEALSTARLALDKMAGGGLYDHLGGGFHRYSTDARWLVPHFEKMLYDNALLVPAYLEAFQATKNSEYERVARETLEYVLREMTQPDGGFYSTQDADSEGVEGKYFVWSEDEIVDCLGEEQAKIFGYVYDVTATGNWEGANILNRPKSLRDCAQILEIDEQSLRESLGHSRDRLLQRRMQRIAPGRDDKVLVSWNGMMISALSQAAQILSVREYSAAAEAAARFILQRMRAPDGRLRHSYKDGQARFNAYLDDYACLVDGFVDLYQATSDQSYIEEATRLAEEMINHFYDDKEGGFFYTSDDHEQLIVRNKETQDSATPSGNSMAAYALLRLSRLTDRDDWEKVAMETLELLSGQLAKFAMASGQALLALDWSLGETYEVVLADGESVEDADSAIALIHQGFLPNKVVIRKKSGSAEHSAMGSITAGKEPQQGLPTVYLCERGRCQEPVAGIDAISAAVASLTG